MKRCSEANPMHKKTWTFNFKTQNSILQAKHIHAVFLKKGLLYSCLSLSNRILQMYVRCGGVSYAPNLFDEMPQTNSFSWNTLIEGYMKAGMKEESVALFESMPDRNDYSWDVIFSGFVKAGELGVARRLFDAMPRRNEVAWNSMIHAYYRNGFSGEAVRLFKELNLDPFERACGSDSFVLATVIRACADLGVISCGKQLHTRVLIGGLEFDSVLASCLINFYGKCGDLDSAKFVLSCMEEPDDFSISALITGCANSARMDDARRIFDSKRSSCNVVWNSLISGYVNNNQETEAILIFINMRENGVQVDFSTITSILSAISIFGGYLQGKQIHACAYKVGLAEDLVVACAFIDAYSKCGSPDDACKYFSELKVQDTILLNSMITVYSSCGRIEDAMRAFNGMPSKTLISWNAIIVGLSQNGCVLEALDLFRQMNNLDLRTDSFSLASVISACASISSLELGEQIFARATVNGLDSHPVVSTSLVDFYCKCGFVENGRKLFDAMNKCDEISWNSMLMGYATNGHGLKALKLFDDMRNAGVKPTCITFTGVLSGCDHCGFVDEGWKWFQAMKHNYHIDPGIEHYSCMIDLFARSGYLEEAMHLIEHMPFKADMNMWSSVLRGCVAHGDKDLGEKLAKRIIELDPDNSAAYVQLSSLFATSGDWETSALVRKSMKQRKVKKYPGQSWI